MKKGFFDWDTMTVKFGGEMSKPEHRFIAQAMQVPSYKYQVKEAESLGGGWYGATEINTYNATDVFVIIKDGVCIGLMRPYAKVHKIKSQLITISKDTPAPVIAFLKRKNMPYE